MITDKEAIKAFEVLHDYCDERKCKNCIFFEEEKKHTNMCVLRNNNLAYLHIEEVPIVVTYKIKGGA